MASGQSARIGRPGVCSSAPVRGNGQSVDRPGVGADDDAATGATTTATVVIGRHADPSVGGDGPGSGQRAGPDHDDPATRAARGCKPGGVVAAPCATATAEDDPAGSGRECSASEAAPRQVRVPAVAALAALVSVGPAAAALVVIVDRWVRVGSATARGARRTSGRITAGVAVRHGGN